MTIKISDLTGASSEELMKLIKRRHPEYADNVDHWEFLASCYSGGRDWIQDNLFKYHKEGVREFEDRKKRAYRFPHTREVVNLVNKYVFKSEIARRDSTPAEITRFWNSSTLRKRAIQDYMESVSQWSSTMGRVWVVVDNNFPAAVRSVADEKASKGRVFSYFIKPGAALDYAYDEDGELEWFMHLEAKREDKNPLTSNGEVVNQYRLWTKEFTVLIERTGSRSNGGAAVVEGSYRKYDIGMVPIFSADHLISDELYAPPGMVEDVAYLDRAVTNYLSNLDAIIQDQTFSQLTIPYQGILPSEDDTEDEDQNHVNALIRMGTKRIFAYNAEGGAAPEFISPDPKQAALITSTIGKIISEIYHSIGMAGERTKSDNSQGIDNSSGVAKAYDFERLNAMLAAKARSLQFVEMNMIRLVLAWHGNAQEIEDIEQYVTYPSSFDVRSLIDEMDSAQRLAVMSAPTELRRAQMSRLAKKMFPQAEDGDMSKIIKDIEDEWLEMPEGLELGAGPSLNSDGADAGRGVPGKANRQGENTGKSDD